MIERLRGAGISVNTDWQEGERVLAQENGHTREMSRSQKRAMETASVSHDEEHQHAVISFADGAKVQQNSEITKLSSKKEPPPNSVPITLRWAAAHDRLGFTTAGNASLPPYAQIAWFSSASQPVRQEIANET